MKYICATNVQPQLRLLGNLVLFSKHYTI